MSDIETDKNCGKCGQYRKVRSPNIPCDGYGKKGVLAVGQSPGVVEDRKGENFVGSSGDLVTDVMRTYGLEFKRDFYVANAFRCKPSGKNFLMYQKCCHHRLVGDIKRLKPWLIVAFGKEAIQSVFGIFHPITTKQFQDLLIPRVEYGCWVYCTYHPAWVIRNERDNKDLFIDAVGRIAELIEDSEEEGLEFEWRHRTDWQLDNVETVTDFDKAVEYLRSLRQVEKFAFDWENYPLRPFSNDSRVLCVGLAVDGDHGKCIPLDKIPVPKREVYWSPRQRRIIGQELKETLQTEGPLKIAHNIQHEMLWTKFIGAELARPWTCTMVRQHLRWEKSGAGKNGWYGPKSLKFQMFARRGLWPYDEHLKPPNMNYGLLNDKDLFDYNACDAKFTYWLYDEQERENYRGIGVAERIHIEYGCKAMAEMTWNGVEVDKKVVSSLSGEWQDQLKEVKSELINCSYGRKWKKKYKTEIDLNSGKQVGEMLFEIQKLPGGKKTPKSGQWKTTEDIIQDLIKKGYEWPKNWLRYKKLEKAVGTFLKGYLEDQLHDDGKLHPSFGLGVAETYRGQSDSPNMQNFPNREALVGREIRKAIYAPRGWEIGEFDYSQHEVRVLAMLSKDKVLIDNIVSGHDFHEDYAAKIMEKPASKLTTRERDEGGKRIFVFPIFYGSGWRSIYEDLVANGFKVREKNVKHVYYAFKEKYSGVTAFQKKLAEFFRDNAYVETPLGYRRREPMTYTALVNFPVQNVAFALLLYAAAKTMDAIKDQEMKAKGIFQIHDSAGFIYPKNERRQLFDLVLDNFLEFPWKFTETVPLKVGAKVGKNWLEMRKINL